MYIEYHGELVTDFKQENLAKNWMANRKDKNLLAEDIKIARQERVNESIHCLYWKWKRWCIHKTVICEIDSVFQDVVLESISLESPMLFVF